MQDWKLALVVGGVALGGVVVGAQCFGARPVQAQATGYTRCMIARQETLDTGRDGVITRPTTAEIIEVPTGWEVVGGGGPGGNWVGTIVLCRR